MLLITCVSTCNVDFVPLENCIALYSTNRGVDFRDSGDFSVLKRFVLLSTWAEGRKSAEQTKFYGKKAFSVAGQMVLNNLYTTVTSSTFR